MPGSLVVPLLVLIKHVNLHWLLGVSQPAAQGLGGGPVEVTGKAEADVGGRLASPLPLGALAGLWSPPALSSCSPLLFSRPGEPGSLRRVCGASWPLAPPC